MYQTLWGVIFSHKKSYYFAISLFYEILISSLSIEIAIKMINKLYLLLKTSSLLIGIALFFIKVEICVYPIALDFLR
jgi:hypothetical protein